MEKEKYIKGLYGIRGISCFILAFFHHYLGDVKINNAIIDSLFLTLRNWSSTYAFIAISGFLFAWLYCDRKMEFEYFIKKRIIRIYPLFIITTLVTAIMEYAFYIATGYTYGGVNCDLFHLFLNFFLIQNYLVTDIGNSFNGAANTICQLMICYVLFWMTTNFTKNKFQRIVSWFGLCIVGVWCYNMKPSISIPLLSWVMGAVYFCFFGSCILCEIYRKFNTLNQRTLLSIISILMILLYIGIYYIGGKELIGDSSKYGITYIFFIVFPIIMLVTCGRVVPKILSLSLLEKLGKMSFSIYLWNFPIFFGIFIILNLFNLKNTVESIWVWIISVGIELIISFISYCIIEKKLTKFLMNKVKCEREDSIRYNTD